MKIPHARSLGFDTPVSFFTHAPTFFREGFMKAHRITLADDDPNALFLLHRMVEQLYPGSSISMFSNAEDALAHIRDTGTDILITNHGMGRMNGTELIRILRAQKVEIPIVMVSGDPRVYNEAMDAGANAFIEKSLDMTSIRNCIQQLLGE